MKYNRLQNFQNDNAKLSRYRLALGILYELGVDQLLADLGVAKDVSEDHPNTAIVNALQNQRALGYRECIAKLFTLDEINIPEESGIARDYGALDKMVAEGRINPKDRDGFLEGLE